MKKKAIIADSKSPSLGLMYLSLALAVFSAVPASAEGFAGGVLKGAYCDMLSLIEGNFGGLLAVAAAVVAIGSAALGNFKHGTSLIMVAVGAFTISTGVGIYFEGMECGGAGGGTGKTVSRAADDSVLSTWSTVIAPESSSAKSEQDGEDQEQNDPFQSF